MTNVFCIDCKRPVSDHAPECENALAHDLLTEIFPGQLQFGHSPAGTHV